MAGGYGHNPTGAERLARRLRALEERQTALERALKGIGLQIDPATNALVVSNGRSVASSNYAAGASGFKLDATGNAEFNSLTLRGGIIGDDALQHPTKVLKNFADVNNTTLTVAGADLAVASITVPAGFTSAQVLCFASVGNARDNVNGAAPFYCQAWVGKVGGGSTSSAVIAATCQQSGGMSLSSGWADVITGLSGGDVIQGGAWAAVDSTTGWPTNAANAHSVVCATFYR
jgi:hypothetical protein